jgi:hypothetical protein
VKYMMLVCADESLELSPEEQAKAGPRFDAWFKDVTSRGIRLDGERLQSVSNATTVRVRDEELLISDGPFAETKEQIVGFDIIDCKDLDEAIDVASRHPVARFGTIEVRPFWTE